MFERYKDLLNENNDLMSKVECFAEEKEELNATMAEPTKLITDL